MKNLNLLRMEKAFHFSSFLKDFHWVNKTIFLESENPALSNVQYQKLRFFGTFWNISLLIAVLIRLGVHSHERRNELKLPWDLISVENLSQIFTCVKLKTVWILYRSFWPKWNLKLAWGFHVNIICPKRNE